MADDPLAQAVTDQPSVEEARENIRLDLTMCGPEDLDAYAAAVRRDTLREVREAVRFTQEDVERLRYSATNIRLNLDKQGPHATWDFPQAEMDGKREHAAWLDELASRIADVLDRLEARE